MNSSGYFFYASSFSSSRAVDIRAPTEVLQLEELAKLDLAFSCFAVRSGGAPGPFDRFFPRLHLDQPISGNQLLGLRKGPLDDRSLASREFDARALRARLEPRQIEHHAGFRQFLVVP